MPITITFSDKPPLIIDEYNGMFLEDIHPEYSADLPDDSKEDLPPFNFTTSPLW